MAAVGDDAAGEALLAYFRGKKVETSGLLRARDWKTPAKTRFLAGWPHTARQQVLRVDREPQALPAQTAKLLERKSREEAEKYSAHRRALIGSGGREEKIRTYNFPQSRITDHRIGFTVHNLEAFLAGSIGEMVEALQASEMAERLAEAGAS